MSSVEDATMALFRFLNTGLFFSAVLLGGLLSLAPTGGAAAGRSEELHQLCRGLRNDDRLRAYSPALRAGTLAAFKKLAPNAQGVPADDELKTQAIFRCVDGKVLVCFIGANLPCAKMNAARDNPGADRFCRENRNDDDVPAVATGHDAVYSYRCRNGRAEITGTLWELDERGFAKRLWAEVPER
jgi:hypothetical protein